MAGSVCGGVAAISQLDAPPAGAVKVPPPLHRRPATARSLDFSPGRRVGQGPAEQVAQVRGGHVPVGRGALHDDHRGLAGQGVSHREVRCPGHARQAPALPGGGSMAGVQVHQAPPGGGLSEPGEEALGARVEGVHQGHLADGDLAVPHPGQGALEAGAVGDQPDRARRRGGPARGPFAQRREPGGGEARLGEAAGVAAPPAEGELGDHEEPLGSRAGGQGSQAPARLGLPALDARGGTAAGQDAGAAAPAVEEDHQLPRGRGVEARGPVDHHVRRALGGLVAGFAQAELQGRFGQRPAGPLAPGGRGVCRGPGFRRLFGLVRLDRVPFARSASFRAGCGPAAGRLFSPLRRFRLRPRPRRRLRAALGAGAVEEHEREHQRGAQDHRAHLVGTSRSRPPRCSMRAAMEPPQSHPPGFATTVRALLDDPAIAQMTRLVAGSEALDRVLDHPRIQKSGLVLVGHLVGLVPTRVQVLGETELAFLESLPAGERARRCADFLAQELSLVVVSRGVDPPEALVAAARAHGTPLVVAEPRSSRTIQVIHAVLDRLLAPTITQHGVLIDIHGIGTLLLGPSGIGKSECALFLLDRGHRLVADDQVMIRRTPEGTLVGRPPPLLRHHLELRGVGILNVRDLFGATAVRDQKFVQLIIELQPVESGEPIDRLGLDDLTRSILEVPLPFLRVPVQPGRNMAVILEVAARNQLLKRAGHHAARSFVDRLERSLGRTPAPNASPSSRGADGKPVDEESE
ncbi:MAG: HPr(Ser) kinase/phosphatase [Sandaracinus sp.]|nr:HPr(Ser) kinase/phosphatase [Sandaracinus sp.]